MHACLCACMHACLCVCMRVRLFVCLEAHLHIVNSPLHAVFLWEGGSDGDLDEYCDDVFNRPGKRRMPSANSATSVEMKSSPVLAEQYGGV